MPRTSPPISEIRSGAPPRRPDGVLLETPAALPPPSDRAPARGIVSLREPFDRSYVAGIVRSFFGAWQRASLGDLTALLAADAGPLEARDRGRAALAELWRQRLQTRDYGKLAGIELIRPERIELWTWDELDGPKAPSRPADMRPGEIYVRAPIEVTHAGGERLFGDIAVLVLRRVGGELRIASYGEIEP